MDSKKPVTLHKIAGLLKAFALHHPAGSITLKISPIAGAQVAFGEYGEIVGETAEHELVLAESFYLYKWGNLTTLNLSCVKTLNLAHCPYGVRGLAESLQAGHLKKLQVLSFQGRADLEDEEAEDLAESFRSGHVSNLTHLILNSTGVGDEGVKALAESFPHVSKLEILDLGNTKIGDEVAVALANSCRSGHLRKLKQLHLSDCEIGDEGVVALAESFQSGHMCNLETLILSGTGGRVGDEGVVALAESFKSGHVTKLKVLDLGDGSVGDEGVVALADSFLSGHVTNLRELILEADNGVGDKGAIALAESFKAGHLCNLEYLRLSRCAIGDKGAMALAASFRSDQASNLKHLSLQSGEIEHKGVTDLVESFPHVSKLEILDLLQTSIGDEGMVALANSWRSGHLRKLKELWVSLTTVGDAGMVALAQSFQLGPESDLKLLNLLGYGWNVREAGMQALVKSFRSGRLRNLTSVYLSGIIADDGIVDLARALEDGCLPFLKQLGLMCLLTEADQQAFVRAYETNTWLVASWFTSTGDSRRIQAIQRLVVRNRRLVAAATIPDIEFPGVL